MQAQINNKAGYFPCQYLNKNLVLLAKLATLARIATSAFITKPAGVTYQAICQQCGTTHNLTTYKRGSGDITLCNRHAGGIV